MRPKQNKKDYIQAELQVVVRRGVGECFSYFFRSNKESTPLL